MDNIYDTFSDYFHTIYKKTSYLDKYGGSAVVTTIVLLSFFLIFSFYFIESNIQPIREDWVNERCKPNIMPFAGYINAPKGTSQVEYTNENFIQCTTGILSQVINIFTKPLYYISDLMTQFFQVLLDAVNKIRLMMLYLRQKLTLIFEYMIARIMNLMIPMQQMLIKLKDLLKKVSGTMVAGMMTVYGAYLTLKAFVGAFMQICILVLIIIAAVVILLWILPFTWPAAAAGSAFFILISIPIILIIVAMSEILKVHPSKKVPGKPGCFDKSTKIKTKEGYKEIYKLHVGDILDDDSKVDAIFKISHNERDMYKLNNVIVSGTHKVYYEKRGWINIEDHPHAILIENYSEPIIYCLNTSSKRIIINNTIFMDWDELTPADMMKLKLWNYIPMNSGFDAIHKHMESGLVGDTEIELFNGSKRKLKDIKPNDVLINGENVITTVEIDASDLNNIRKYKFSKKNLIGGPNLFMKHRDLGNLSTLGFKGEKVNNVNKLYHLITDSDSFKVYNILVKDYNSGIENIIDIRDNLNREF